MNTVSPLAPQRFSDMPAIGGVRAATVDAGIRYKGRDDLLLVELAPGTAIAGALTRPLTASAPVEWCREALVGGRAACDRGQIRQCQRLYRQDRQRCRGAHGGGRGRNARIRRKRGLRLLHGRDRRDQRDRTRLLVACRRKHPALLQSVSSRRRMLAGPHRKRENTMPHDHVMAAAELASRLDEFEHEHPHLVRELDLLGVQIDEYETVLAESEPRIITTSNTTTAA